MIRETDIEIDNLPEGLSGLRIALLADLHIGAPHVPLERLDRIVEATNAQAPDMVLLAGDYVIQGVVGGDPVPPADIFAGLNRLEAPLGVYAVMGNHDWWHGYRQIVGDFQTHAPALSLLEDASAGLEREGAAFRLTGVTDYTEGPMRFADELAASAEEFNIVFTHSPDVFPDLPETVELVLAGHTHGGQVHVPLVGRPIVPSDYGDAYALGIVREGEKTLFVSVGVGTSILPVRFLTPPEINILTLRSAGPKAAP